MADKLGWRWDFWLLTISGGVFSIIMIVVLKETYPSVILERKVARLQKETGNKQLRSKLDSGLSPGAYFLRNIVRPLKLLAFSPIVIITSLFIAVTYGYMCESHSKSFYRQLLLLLRQSSPYHVGFSKHRNLGYRIPYLELRH